MSKYYYDPGGCGVNSLSRPLSLEGDCEVSGCGGVWFGMVRAGLVLGPLFGEAAGFIYSKGASGFPFAPFAFLVCHSKANVGG